MDCDFELVPMSKEEADASIKYMAGFVEYFQRVEEYEEIIGKPLEFANEDSQEMKDFDKWYKEKYGNNE